MRVINSVGIELECGLPGEIFNDVAGEFNNCVSDTDGSVNVSGSSDCGGFNWVSRAEIKIHGNKQYIFDFLKWIYDNGAETNNTCGLHIHIKATDDIFPLFANKLFVSRFIKEYRKKYSGNQKYINRLNSHYAGFNRFNEAGYIKQINRDYKDSSRYNAINFNSYKELGTVEFRILPGADSASEAIEAINWLTRTASNLVNGIYKKSVLIKEVPPVEKSELIIFPYAIEPGYIQKNYEIKKEVLQCVC